MSESTSSNGTAVHHGPMTNTNTKPAPVSIDTSKPTISESDRGRITSMDIPLEHVHSPMSPGLPNGAHTPLQRHASFDIDDYFTGPRDISRHSKWPNILRMHGSILPRMVLPLFLIGGWATAITLISKNVYNLGVDSVLLTITGFVVGLGLSFRSSTAYERYNEGRRYWQMLIQTSQGLGRVFWVHATDAPDADPRESLLKKISALNMIVAFAVSLKHHLRFEPYSAYPDMAHLIGHLNTFAREASRIDPETLKPKKKNLFKETGEYLGVSFATSNPRKALKKCRAPLGNLPLEILNHLALCVDSMCSAGQLPIGMQQTLGYNSLVALNDALCGCERILNTPLPIAYTIAISQITWVYVILLPFQLLPLLSWVAIPATIFASYIILGLLFIGAEIENPFGQDVK